eukprot:358390-Chlamydomonas_euryale.AAC.11
MSVLVLSCLLRTCHRHLSVAVCAGLLWLSVPHRADVDPHGVLRHAGLPTHQVGGQRHRAHGLTDLHTVCAIGACMRRAAGLSAMLGCGVQKCLPAVHACSMQQALHAVLVIARVLQHVEATGVWCARVMRAPSRWALLHERVQLGSDMPSTHAWRAVGSHFAWRAVGSHFAWRAVGSHFAWRAVGSYPAWRAVGSHFAWRA